MNQNSLKKKLLLIMILSSGLIGGLISSYAESHAARVQAVEQTKNVAGTVTDENGDPLIGVSVSAGPGLGVVTDLDGRFSLNGVTANTVLTFSYVGYATQEIRVGSQNNINVRLIEDNTVLDEFCCRIRRAEKSQSYWCRLCRRWR